VPGTIRSAVAADAAAIAALVRDAYTMYLPRMGKPPGPMLADYAAIVARGEASVLELDGAIVGAIVLVDEVDHLLLDNVAVVPTRKGQGLGRELVAFAEAEARRRGFREVRLYTHETMTENQALYARLGFVETHRAEQDGYARVFMTKRL
jgi:ribosomal protein S18 acetylase RimI-like enzyme